MVIPRYLTPHLQQHIAAYRQMVFLSGPRQTGKTTIAKELINHIPRASYFSWDIHAHRTGPLQDPTTVERALQLDEIGNASTLCIFDEIHKRANWRDFLKSLFDGNQNLRMLVTGSASLKEFGRGGDSLRGRYLPYTLHPFSLAELIWEHPCQTELLHSYPRTIPADQWQALIKFGGFPDPLLKGSESFHNQWRATWHDQLLREDVRDLTRVQELSQIESLAIQLQHGAGSLMNHSSLARHIGCSVDSIRRWIEILKSLFYCFSISPWFRNVPRSLRKEPKYYLWDWSQVSDDGARNENLVACALLKATQFWTETGQGNFTLHFLRDKQKREVDFLLVRDGAPWILIEVKSSRKTMLSPHLSYFQRNLGVPFALQVAFDAEFVDVDCVRLEQPKIVPAKSFLSQLI